jgi:class 3 adenylate cyclase
MERRLAAVLIVDVTGYGRLSQADEEGMRPPTIGCHQGDAATISQARCLD